MGYCTYTVGKSSIVAAWIGTGTDVGKQITWSFKPGATNKTAACNRVRNEFCKKFGVAGGCYDKALNYKEPKAPNCVNSLADQAYWFAKGKTNVCICGDSACGGSSSGDKPAGEYCAGGLKKDICAKKCGPVLLDPLCNSAKWQCSCGGSNPDIVGNVCGSLPAPFNDCKNVIIFAVVGIAFLWTLKK